MGPAHVKDAAVRHAWQSVTAEWRPTGFKSISASREVGFAESTAELMGGLALLAGVNSGGKSRLLRALNGHISTGAVEIASIAWTDEPPRQSQYVDFFELLTRQWTILSQTPDLEDQASAAGMTELRADPKRSIEYIVGRQYELIEFAELENTRIDESSENSFRRDVVPYFRVRSHGSSYDSNSLSRGELSALTLNWVLSQAEVGEVLLLDEPDVLLSPHSAGRALDLIVTTVNRTKTPAIVASHSYLGIASTPPSSQVLLRLGIDGKTRLEAATSFELWKALRVAAPRSIILVVEDEMARHLTWRLLTLVDYRYTELTSIWIGQNESEVRQAASFPDCKEADVAIWGVLDGNEAIARPESHLAKLPGPWSPEGGAIEIAAGCSDFMASKRPEIDAALEATVGVDPHRRVGEVARAIGLTAHDLVVESWLYWLLNTDEGKSSLEEFRGHVGRIRPPM
jgi:ABC-type cobalamin/Fe3+-siderophores transport system ATPase subunit